MGKKRQKRLSRLWEIAVRARCEPGHVVRAINGTHRGGWDIDYLLARYQRFYGTPLKVATLHRIYREERERSANRTPAHVGPALQAKLDALGKALG